MFEASTEVPAVTTPYLSAVLWGNAKYPQMQHTQAILSGAVVLHEVAERGLDAWSDFLDAQPTDDQVRKMAIAAQTAHQNAGIVLPYNPAMRSSYLDDPEGPRVAHFGNDYLTGLLDVNRGIIRDAVDEWAYITVCTGKRYVNLTDDLLDGHHPEELAALTTMWQAGAVALHGTRALAIGDNLRGELQTLDISAPGHRRARQRLVHAAGAALDPVIRGSFIGAADQHPSVKGLQAYTLMRMLVDR